jgi:phosphate transport system substrate-binding protein
MKNPSKLALVAMATLSCAGVAPAQSINAAGATFPEIIYKKWFNEYQKLHPGVEINYQAIGSGGGVRQVVEGTLDFGASDRPMTDEEIAKCKSKPLHFPTVLGGDVPAYNFPGVTQKLKLSSEAMAGIFLLKITKWNDPKIAATNKGLKLPAEDIQVVHRSDGSGTTFIWTDYLSKISPAWKAGPGTSQSPKWPGGLGQSGNDGVTGTIKQTPYSIGYVELGFALQNKTLQYAMLQNADGQFVDATTDTISAAAAGAVKSMPADFRVSIANAPGKNSFPASSFTWLLIPSKIDDTKKRDAIVNFLKWMLTDGQKDAPALGYAPLPKEVIAMEQKQIALIK